MAKLPVTITLVDRQNYHLFQPLLYQVATAGLSAGDIASPIRGVVARHQNVSVRLGSVTGVDLAARRVDIEGQAPLTYDSLVLAAGVRHSYFGHSEWEQYAPGLKTLDDALEIRRRVLLAFEAAELEGDAAVRKALLTFVIVGAGPTGVELAGAIAELARFTVANDFRSIDPKTARVVLVEGGDRVLSAFAPELSEAARRSLQKLGVEVQLNKRVTSVGPNGVVIGGEPTPLASRTVLWAAGVEAMPLGKSLGVELDRTGRVKVNERCEVPGHPEVYVIGDLAHCPGADGQPLPGLAPVAMQQGLYVAKSVGARVAGKSLEKPFRYVDKGIMATVGRASGIAQTGPLKMKGLLGWLAWLVIHVLYLIGFRNRVLVLIQWAWAWLTYGRSARLITGSPQLPAPKTPVGGTT